MVGEGVVRSRRRPSRAPEARTPAARGTGRGRRGALRLVAAALLLFALPAAAALLLFALPAAAEPDGEPTLEELARADQNPITRFYVMRFEENAQFGYGPDDEALNYFRIQPLVPLRLSENWRLLARIILPIAHSPWPESVNGLSDTSLIAFFTPAKAKKLVWGIGPAFLFPTATSETLGTGKWSMGPAAAAVYNTGPWMLGAVYQHLWSFAGDGDRRAVNLMTLRPLVNYNLPRGWYLTSSPSIIADWKADAGSRWLVPLGGGAGRVYKLGRLRMSTTFELYYHVVSPPIGPDWQIRVQHSFLYRE